MDSSEFGKTIKKLRVTDEPDEEGELNVWMIGRYGMEIDTWLSKSEAMKLRDHLTAAYEI